jgi:DNA-binding LacI/PurR family transcriptional regulator/DNA-binding transcriptional regulator YhcF (GntR family)
MEQNGKLYEVIINYLEKQIADGVYDNNVRLPTEASLSEMFNVSRITTRRALDELELKGLIVRRQGSGSYLSGNAKKTKSMETFSGSSDNGGDNTVSFIFPYGSLGGRVIEIVQGASDVLETHGYHLVLHNSRTDEQIEREIMQKLIKTGTRGIIFYPNNDTTNIDLLYQIWLQKFPFIVIDKKIHDIPICGVCSDNFTGSYELTRKLIANGHVNIACFYYVDLVGTSSVRERFFGYCSALRDGGIPVNLDYVINYEKITIQTDKKREEIIAELLESGVTAVVTQNDYTALDIIDICNRLNIKIPNQLSIVGFDNVPQSEYTKPPLTTVEQDFAAIGRIAAETIIAQIEEKHFETEQIIPCKIIERKSIANIRV